MDGKRIKLQFNRDRGDYAIDATRIINLIAQIDYARDSHDDDDLTSNNWDVERTGEDQRRPDFSDFRASIQCES